VDLVIPEPSVPAVLSTMEACGFWRVVGSRRCEGPWNSNETTLVKAASPGTPQFDLHWRLLHRGYPFQIDTAEVLARSRTVLAGGMAVRVPSGEDTFVNIAVQIIQGFKLKLQRAGDLYALARSPIAWEGVVDVAARSHAAGVTHLACGVAALLGADVPAWVSERLAARCRGCGAATDFLADARWLTRGTVLPHAALPTLRALITEGDRLRLIRPLAAPWRSYVGARALGRGTLQSLAGAARLAALVPLWAGGLVSVISLPASGRGRGSARIRGALWKSASVTSAAIRR
jgi:hypothetical protein